MAFTHPRLGSAAPRLAALALTLASLASGAAPLPAQAKAASPSLALPAVERMVYERKVGDKRDKIEMSTRLVSAKGESWFEESARYPEQDILLRLDPRTLFAAHFEVTSRSKDSTILKVTSVLENRSSAKQEEFLVSSFESLTFSLRAFPWGERQKAKIAFLGSFGGGDYRFDLSVAGKETLPVGDRQVECWKAQLSLGGLMGSFLGKTTLWYSCDYPHYLVRSEGASGPPGTPTTVLSLSSYSSESRAE
jgi:hypothetical protein